MEIIRGLRMLNSKDIKMLDWIAVSESISYRVVEGTQRFSG